MGKLEGKVSRVRFSTGVSGGEAASAEQIAIFEINGCSVEFRSKESIIVDDGDNCIVAGLIENGLFKALALNNKTKGIYSVNNSKFLRIFGSIFTIVGIITIPVLVGMVFIYIGLKIIQQSNLVNEAHKMVLQNS